MRLLGRVWECSESAVIGKLVGSYSEARGGALEVLCSLSVLTHLSAGLKSLYIYIESMPQVIQNTQGTPAPDRFKHNTRAHFFIFHKP